jgi:hypothetical protein
MPETTSRRTTVQDDSGIAETTTTVNQEATDSAEISVNAKGEASFKSKVYGQTPEGVVLAAHKAAEHMSALLNVPIKSLNPTS